MIAGVFSRHSGRWFARFPVARPPWVAAMLKPGAIRTNAFLVAATPVISAVGAAPIVLTTERAARLTRLDSHALPRPVDAVGLLAGIAERDEQSATFRNRDALTAAVVGLAGREAFPIPSA